MALLTSGCALVAKGTVQDVAFTSAPEGAEVIIDGEPYGTTPLTIPLSVATSHDVVLRYRGQERHIHIANTVDPTWIALDVVPGLAVGTLDVSHRLPQSQAFPFYSLRSTREREARGACS